MIPRLFTVDFDKLALCAISDLKLFVSPGAEDKPYWACYEDYEEDYQIATPYDFSLEFEKSYGFGMSFYNPQDVSDVELIGLDEPICITYHTWQ